eukprot:15548666-Heterocapsa_arctica.AAC.1
MLSANGNQHSEIKNRISVTLMTLKQLNVFWTKSPATIKWKLRVFDAVIVSKLLYGLEALSISPSDSDKLNAFQNKGLRKILGIKHSYWSRVSNKDIMIQANYRARLPEGKSIQTMSDRLYRKQLTLFGHLLRAPEDDLLKLVS